MTGTTLRPPLAYYGGKITVAARIAELLPTHAHSWNRSRARWRVLRPKHRRGWKPSTTARGDLMCFWRVLRGRLRRPDRPGRPRTARRIVDTPRPGTDRHDAHNRTGWRHYADPGESSAAMPRYLTGYLERMRPTADRIWPGRRWSAATRST